MSKRKRGDSETFQGTSRNDPDGNTRLRKQQIEGAIQNGNKTVFRALKVARGFERQKLGRRQKVANEKKAPEEIARLNAEVAALKVSLGSGGHRLIC